MSPAAASTAPMPTAPSPAVTPSGEAAAAAAIATACRALLLPTIREQAGPQAQAAVRERVSHQGYLAEVLAAECDDREDSGRIRRVKEVKFPRTKSLADFDTTATAELPAASLAQLATGAWIDAGEPLVLLGDSGTGMKHQLLSATHHPQPEWSRHHLIFGPHPENRRTAPTPRWHQSTDPGVGPNQVITVGPKGVVILMARASFESAPAHIPVTRAVTFVRRWRPCRSAP